MTKNVLKFHQLEITPEILDLFRRGLAIIEADGDRTWEEEGGERAEYFEIESALDRALNRTKPWQVSPLATYDELADGHTADYVREFDRAKRLRLELEEALTRRRC